MEAIYIQRDSFSRRVWKAQGRQTHLVVESIHRISTGHGSHARRQVRCAVLDVRHLIAWVIVLLSIRVLSATAAVASSIISGVLGGV